MTIEPNSPEEVFGLIGNEVRVEIVQILGESDGGPLSYSAIRDRVGVRDSGRFNYHLQQLATTFVRSSDEGYELTYAGHQVYGAIISGEYSRQDEPRTFELDSRCLSCESTITATYRDEHVDVRCPDCDRLLSHFGFPPGAIAGRTPEDLTRVFERYVFDLARVMDGGICPNCYGTVRRYLSDELGERREGDPVKVVLDCDRCPDAMDVSVNAYLLSHPAVVSFYHAHGIDLNRVERWNLAFLAESEIDVVSRSPWRIRSVLELDGDRLEIHLSDDLTIDVEEI